LALSADKENWLLCNTAPELRAQILVSPQLRPVIGPRDSPIRAVLLTGAEIDQTAGLLSLRERQQFRLYATPATHAAIAGNPMFSALDRELVSRHAVSPGETLEPLTGLRVEVFSVPGKMPLYQEGENPQIVESAVNIGLEISSDGRRLLFVPGAAAITEALHTRLSRADVILFDGTLFTDEEMIVSGTGTKTGLRMGHMPVAGQEGSLAALSGLTARRIYIHINNTNPMLIEGSPERCAVEAAGIEIAYDGMEIVP
jgi:pyrroloquinoline quinone biosynthesis protein B